MRSKIRLAANSENIREGAGRPCKLSGLESVRDTPEFAKFRNEVARRRAIMKRRWKPCATNSAFQPNECVLYALSRSAAMRSSGMPHNPKPPGAIVMFAEQALRAAVGSE